MKQALFAVKHDHFWTVALVLMWLFLIYGQDASQRYDRRQHETPQATFPDLTPYDEVKPAQTR